jgi:predicted 3-demethylubiquinone-9 3-methyltransferase (glyoxalase superfamily)
MTEQKITPCLWFDFNAEEARPLAAARARLRWWR